MQHSRVVRASVILGLVVFVLVMSLAAAACGGGSTTAGGTPSATSPPPVTSGQTPSAGDSYSGTWSVSRDGSTMTLDIRKRGDAWMITGRLGAEGAAPETLEGSVTKGQLVVVAPDGSGTVRFEADGDQLLMFLRGAPEAIVLTRK